jgi:hypothetical protein
MVRKREAILAGCVYVVTSILVSLVLALPDEAFFEDLYPARLEQPRWGLLLWLAHKVLYGLGVGMLYHWARTALRGPGWRQGSLFGIVTATLSVATYLGEWPVLGGEGALWFWWSVCAVIAGTVSGAAMGTAVERFGKSERAA